MKRFIKEFCKRGLVAFGFGPVVMAIVYICIEWSGVENYLSMAEVGKHVLLVSLMAFLAAGITAVYQIEKLPLPFAIFIQAAVLYVDYVVVYIVNGWIQSAIVPIMVFTAVFIAGFATVWLIVYFVNQKTAKKLNENLKDK